ncbi:MAG: hypothetical protein OXE97_09035 [Gammaproteobacteria bacterium]|nr:hypothetical protein [Gammaproteobacteria bacterium]
MAIRTVRLDDDAETILKTLQKQTGLSISNVLKQGLACFVKAQEIAAATKPYDIYRELDLGPGDESAPAAAEAKSAVVGIIRQKHGR